MYITIDIGGTNTRIATFNDIPSKSETSFQTFKTSEKYSEGIYNIDSVIEKLIAEDTLQGLGLSVAIPFDAHYHTVFDANLPGWNAQRLLRDMKEKYNVTVRVVNDTSAGAVAEALSRDDKEFIYLSWGTGFGGVTVKKNDEVWYIYEYEPGHKVLVDNGRPCVCGKKGCLEAYIGGEAIEKNYGKGAQQLNDDEWDEILEYAAMGINSILMSSKTNLVILNGHVPIAHPNFFGRLVEKVSRRSGKLISLQKAKAGEKAPLHGVLALLEKSSRINIRKIEN